MMAMMVMMEAVVRALGSHASGPWLARSGPAAASTKGFPGPMGRIQAKCPWCHEWEASVANDRANLSIYANARATATGRTDDSLAKASMEIKIQCSCRPRLARRRGLMPSMPRPRERAYAASMPDRVTAPPPPTWEGHRRYRIRHTRRRRRRRRRQAVTGCRQRDVAPCHGDCGVPLRIPPPPFSAIRVVKSHL